MPLAVDGFIFNMAAVSDSSAPGRARLQTSMMIWTQLATTSTVIKFKLIKLAKKHHFPVTHSAWTVVPSPASLGYNLTLLIENVKGFRPHPRIGSVKLYVVAIYSKCMDHVARFQVTVDGGGMGIGQLSGILPGGMLKFQLSRLGDIEFELYWRHAPKTCRNFVELINRGYYNNCKFHRVIKDFMIQTGDPTGTGRGGASIFGPTFEDEITKDLKHTGAGILSMANSGPNTNGSQFFVTLAPVQWLDGKHTIFGRVSKGIGVVNRIGLVETANNDRPLHDVCITGGAV